MVSVRRVEQAGDTPWIWCVLACTCWQSAKLTSAERTAPNMIFRLFMIYFSFFLLLFWPFLISRWRTQFRLFVLPGPKQYPDPRGVLPEMQVGCQEERLDFFFGGRKKARSTRLRSPRRPPAWQARSAPLAPQDRAHQSLPHSARERGAKRRDKPGLTMGLPAACKTLFLSS